MRTGLLRAHDVSVEEVTDQCVTASGIAAIGREINHDAELLVHHHILAELTVGIEDAGWTCSDTSKPDHPASELFEQILDDLREDDHSFFREISQLYNCLHPAGITNKLEGVVRALSSGQPLSPDSANDPVIARVIEDSIQYRQVVMSGNNQNLLELVLNESQKIPSEILSEEKFSEYLCATFSGTEQDRDNIDLIEYDDGSLQCNCEFCKPRFETWEQVRHNGEIPPMSQLQEDICRMLQVDLREFAMMTDEEEEEDVDMEFMEDEDVLEEGEIEDSDAMEEGEIEDSDAMEEDGDSMEEF